MTITRAKLHSLVVLYISLIENTKKLHFTEKNEQICDNFRGSKFA